MIDLALSLIGNYNKPCISWCNAKSWLLLAWLLALAGGAGPSLSGVAGSELSAPAEAAAPAPVLGTEPRLPWLRQDDPLQPDQCHQAGPRSDMTYSAPVHSVHHCTGVLNSVLKIILSSLQLGQRSDITQYTCTVIQYTTQNCTGVLNPV